MHLWHLCRGLAARGWQPAVVSLIEPGPVAARLRADGIEVVSLGMRRGVPSPAAIARLARHVRELRPALVHSHMFHANLLARIARGLAPGVPLVNSSHVDERGVARQHLAYRATRRLCERFHCVSRAAQGRLLASRAVEPGKLVYIPNGVPEPAAPDDARERLRAELALGDGFVFLCVGRLHPDKDPQNLLDAFARVARAEAGARLLVAGEGPLASELRAERKRLDPGDRVQLLGARADVAELMRAADALVIPSRSEALPLVLLEAGLARLPVVSTAVGDVASLVEDRRSGMLCAPRDPEALSRAMLELARAPHAARAQWADALRARVVSEYALSAVLDRFEQLYAELALGA